MKTFLIRGDGHKRGLALCVLGGLLALSACGLDDVEIPDLTGPAALGTDLSISATPDVLTADGRSFATITVLVHDQNGAGKGGQGLFLAIADEDGLFADLGTLSAEHVTTDSSGHASVRYTTPPRPDATADQTVLVKVRPVGDDANAAVYRSVRIELRSAEPRLFPQKPNNTAPTCSFILEPAFGPYKVNTSVLVQTTSSDADGTIVRYEWDFGDATEKSDQPDEEHHYGTTGSFTITHTVTDDDGGQAGCSKTIEVED